MNPVSSLSAAKREREVGRSETAELWRLTLENSPIGTALVAPSGDFLRVNTALCEMLGRTAGGLLRATFQELTHPDDLASDLELLTETLDGKRSSYRLIKRYLHALGHVVWGDLSVTLVRDEDGTPRHLVAQVLDITEQRRDREGLTAITDRLRRQAEELESNAAALERTNADLRSFAAMASHDLQTPLAVMSGYLEMLSDSDLDPGRADWVRRAAGARERMSSFVSALLEYTVAGDGPRGLPEPLRLDALLAAALDDLAPLVDRTRAEVTSHGLPVLLGSEPLIRVLLSNLVSNALKHVPEGRPARVHVQGRVLPAGPSAPATRWAEITISDNGAGMSRHDLDHAFEIFSRGQAAATAGHGSGYGIGLATCRRIVEWHHGAIRLDHAASGGLQVTCTLPCQV